MGCREMFTVMSSTYSTLSSKPIVVRPVGRAKVWGRLYRLYELQQLAVVQVVSCSLFFFAFERIMRRQQDMGCGHWDEV